MSTRVGDAIVRLTADPTKFLADSALAGEAAGEKAAGGFKAAFAAIGVGVGATLAVVSITEKTTEWANSVYLLTKQTGLSAETITAWQYGAQKMGVEGDALSTMLGRFAVNAAKADGPLEKMGVDARDAQGNFLPMDAILSTVADRFASMPDGIQKTADAVALFGRTGKAMIPVLDQGSAGLITMREDAAALGVVLSGANVQQFHQLALAQDELNQKLKGLGVTVAEATAGPMLGLVNFVEQRVIPAFRDAAGFAAKIADGVAKMVQPFQDLNNQTSVGVQHVDAFTGALNNNIGPLQAFGLWLEWANGKNVDWLPTIGSTTDALNNMGQGTDESTRSTVKSSEAFNDATIATGKQSVALGDLIPVITAHNAKVDAATGAWAGMKDAIDNLYTPLTDVSNDMDTAAGLEGGLARQSDIATTSMYNQAAAASYLDQMASLAAGALASQASAQIALNQAGAGALAVSGAPVTYGATYQGTVTWPKPPPKPPAGGSGSGPSAASQAAVKDETAADTAAWNKAKQAADTYFQSIHDKAIATATTIHTAALSAIESDRQAAYATAERTANAAKLLLQEQKNKLFDQANADQSALNAKQVAEQQQSLQQAVQDAADAQAANTDPTQANALARAYDQAVTALSDFNEQQRINAEQSAAQKASDALDAANNTIDPVTGAPTTKIDLQEAADKAAADAKAATAKAAADKIFSDAKDGADALLKAQQDAYDDQAKALQTYLKDHKKSHKDNIDAIDKLYKEFHVTMYDHGKAIGEQMAAGLIAAGKTVGEAAAELAKIIADYLATHSPANLGPLHDDSPEDMGSNIVLGLVKGAKSKAAAPAFHSIAEALSGILTPGTGISAQPHGITNHTSTAGSAGYAGAAAGAIDSSVHIHIGAGAFNGFLGSEADVRRFVRRLVPAIDSHVARRGRGIGVGNS